MSSLCGTGDTHCCWFKGVQCQYVQAADNPPYKWKCVLREQYGSWEAVHTSPEYVDNIIPLWNSLDDYNGMTCGDWPELLVNGRCRDCGYGDP